MKRNGWVAVAVAALLASCVVPGLPPGAGHGGADGDRSPARCGREDTPETSIQGDVPLADQQSGRAEQGYNCGLALVGYNDLGGQGGGDLAWSGDCAYVKSPGSIKVVDVRDPASPTVVGALPINVMSENIHAVTTRETALLVAAAAGQPVPVYVWDVRNCTHPVLLGTVEFPGLSPQNPAVFTQVHNIELSPDGTHIYGSLPLAVADITDLADPTTWTVKNFQCELAAQAPLGFQGILFPQTAFALDQPECANILAHEFEFNEAGTRMYIGGQLDGAFATQIDPQHRQWHTEQVLRVVDITGATPRVIGAVEPAPGHGVRRATIRGKDFLLNSNENVNPDVSTANGCTPDTALPVGGAAHAFLTDISHERSPRTVSELELAINDPTHCADQRASGVKSTIHYNDVNDPDRTTFAMLPMGNAGLRIFDVRNPRRPTEVAYFNPGQLRLANGSTTLDRAANHTRYVTRSVPCNGRPHKRCQASYVWLTTRAGGFWVLEIEPHVLRALGLSRDRNATQHPDGRPARPPAVAATEVNVAVTQEHLMGLAAYLANDNQHHQH